MKVYLIVMIDSEGSIEGYESRPFIGTDADEVIKAAYKTYREVYEYERDERESIVEDDEMVSFSEFSIEMRSGFRHPEFPGIICIQCYNYHCQWESRAYEI